MQINLQNLYIGQPLKETILAVSYQYVIHTKYSYD